jgi:hypothetical protein
VYGIFLWEEFYLESCLQLDGQGKYEVKWPLEKSLTLSTKSLYNCLTHGGSKTN